jgi:hypothetical protein
MRALCPKGRMPRASGGSADSSERRVKAGERLTGLLARSAAAGEPKRSAAPLDSVVNGHWTAHDAYDAG